MKDFHFFACMPDGRNSKSASKQFPMQPWTRATLRSYAAAGRYVDCVAVYTDRNLSYVLNGEVQREAITGVYAHENSACCSSSVSHSYLDKRCVRVDEKLARRLHPALFQYLDQT